MDEEYYDEMIDMKDEEIYDLEDEISELENEKHILEDEVEDLKDTIDTKDVQIEFLVEYIVKNINKDFRFSSNKNYYSKGSW